MALGSVKRVRARGGAQASPCSAGGERGAVAGERAGTHREVAAQGRIEPPGNDDAVRPAIILRSFPLTPATRFHSPPYPHVAKAESLAVVHLAFLRYTWRGAVPKFATLGRIFDTELHDLSDLVLPDSRNDPCVAKLDDVQAILYESHNR
jgi:hypothetical protein